MNTKGECRSDSPFPLSLPLFIAFCRILPTNVVICRLQSIAHYTLRSAKRVQGGIPLDPFHEVRTYTQPTVKCASCGAFPPLAFATAPRGGSNPLEQIVRRC